MSSSSSRSSGFIRKNSYEELSPKEKERYVAIIKANSNRKKELVYINQKGDKTAMTLKRFESLFKPFTDGPPIPDLFREKLSPSSVSKEPTKHEQLVDKYSKQLEKEEEDPKKSDIEVIVEIDNGLRSMGMRFDKLDDSQIKQLDRWDKYVSDRLDDKNLPVEIKSKYELLENIIYNQKQYDSDVKKVNSIIEQLNYVKTDFYRYGEEEEQEQANYLQESLQDVYNESNKQLEKIYPGESAYINKRWEKIKDESSKLLIDFFKINPNDPQTRPNELTKITEEYKVQEIGDLQEQYIKSEKDEKEGVPTQEVTEEQVEVISSDAPIGTAPELAVKERELANIYLGSKFEFDTDIETNVSYDPSVVGAASEITMSEVPGSETQVDVDIAATANSDSLDLQPGSGIDETVVETEQVPGDVPKGGMEAGPRIQVKYVFDVKYHKTQIAEYFFVWNQPAWDQQLSDTIKANEDAYTKEYLLSTMNRLIADPRFKIEKVITTVDDKMIDILTEYHEISQIQFCIQRNMQTGKREKLIGMKLKDLVNIASLASGQPPVVNNENGEVGIDDSVSQAGGGDVGGGMGGQGFQPTPTAPNLVDPTQTDIIFPRDKEITMYEIGEVATKLLDNQNKIKNINLKLVSDAQKNSGADVIIGPMNEQNVQTRGINIAALRRVIVDY